MPLIRLPSEHDVSYAPARGPVLLLTCMDLRVLDEVTEFMDHDGLTNRYDHVILAGTVGYPMSFSLTPSRTSPCPRVLRLRRLSASG
jgi:hypothetical protein